MAFCDFCCFEHEEPAYDVDAWMPASLAEVADAMVHARQVNVLSSTGHRAADILMVRALNLLYLEMLSFEPDYITVEANIRRINATYSTLPKWYG